VAVMPGPDLLEPAEIHAAGRLRWMRVEQLDPACRAEYLARAERSERDDGRLTTAPRRHLGIRTAPPGCLDTRRGLTTSKEHPCLPLMPAAAPAYLTIVSIVMPAIASAAPVPLAALGFGIAKLSTVCGHRETSNA
jgi:hypothetical protein